MKTPPILSSLAALALIAATSPALAADGFIGPSPYRSFADSPFQPSFPSSFSYFHLDDFETVTRTPGYSANTGVRLGPSLQTDSVDWDGPINIAPATALVPPGSVNDTGVEGGSWRNNSSILFTFTFNAAQLGALPTHAGIVWTDVGNVLPDAPAGHELGRSFVSFEAKGPAGESLDVILPSGTQGDGNADGGTAEDRFYGAINAAGISSITIVTSFSNDWEVDHLQYGALNPIPEPEQWLLMALGAGVLGLRIRRRNAGV